MIVSRLGEGARIDTEVDGRFRIAADQPAPHGTDSAPSPFDLFLAGLASCTAYYAQLYCRKWRLPHEGIHVTLDPVFDKAHRLTDISMQLHVPDDFPAEHRDGLLRNAGNCLVKKTLESPPSLGLVLAVDNPVATA